MATDDGKDLKAREEIKDAGLRLLTASDDMLRAFETGAPVEEMDSAFAACEVAYADGIAAVERAKKSEAKRGSRRSRGT